MTTRVVSGPSAGVDLLHRNSIGDAEQVKRGTARFAANLTHRGLGSGAAGEGATGEAPPADLHRRCRRCAPPARLDERRKGTPCMEEPEEVVVPFVSIIYRRRRLPAPFLLHRAPGWRAAGIHRHKPPCKAGGALLRVIHLEARPVAPSCVDRPLQVHFALREELNMGEHS